MSEIDSVKANRSDDRFTIAVPARLVPVKGHTYLLDALVILKRSGKMTKVLFAGDGDLRKELEERSKSLSLEISFLGSLKRENNLASIQSSDVVALPSLFEGFPNAVVEAMALSKAVVGSDVGGIQELVDHDRTGFLVPVANSKALANALADLMDHPEKCESMGAEGRKKVERELDILKIRKKWAEYYKHLV